MTPDAPPVEFESVKLLRLHPDDVVVLRVENDDLSEQDVADVTERLKSTFPSHQVVVLGDGAELQVFRRD